MRRYESINIQILENTNKIINICVIVPQHILRGSFASGRDSVRSFCWISHLRTPPTKTTVIFEWWISPLVICREGSVLPKPFLQPSDDFKLLIHLRALGDLAVRVNHQKYRIVEIQKMSRNQNKTISVRPKSYSDFCYVISHCLSFFRMFQRRPTRRMLHDVIIRNNM